jgi:hypothetical protein
MNRKSASIALIVACLLAGCGGTTPTAPPPSPAASPAARVDASAPVIDGVQTPASSGNPVPSPVATPTIAASPTPQAAVTGLLEAGTYRVTNPLLTLRPFTFTVPDGWHRDENFLNKGDVWEGNGVTMATWVVSHIYRDSCQWEGTLRQTTSVAEVVQALNEQTGHESTEPSATTFAGYPATRLELSLPADADLSGCDGQFARLWPDAGPKEQYGLPIFPGQTTTVYVVDLDSKPALIVAIANETSTAADVTELEQVIESIRFQ